MDAFQNVLAKSITRDLNRNEMKETSEAVEAAIVEREYMLETITDLQAKLAALNAQLVDLIRSCNTKFTSTGGV